MVCNMHRWGGKNIRMLVYERGGIVDFIVDDDVEIFLAGVLGNVGVGNLF